jgi:hypothetical protein
MRTAWQHPCAPISIWLSAVPALLLMSGAPVILAAPCPDVDADGYADCTVPGCNIAGLACGDCDDGAAYVHPTAAEICDHRDDDCDGGVDEGFVLQTSTRALIDRHPHANDRFGMSFVSLGDVNNDDVPDFVVGNPQDDLGATDGGSVTLYSGADRRVLCRASGAGGDILGVSVAATGDMNGDGIPDFAASEPYHDAIAVLSGADCSQVARCVDTASGVSNLGGDHGLARLADLTGDAIPEILAGADSSSTTLHQGGRAVVFTVSAGGTCTTLRSLDDPELAIYAYLGSAISGLDDVTGDGVSDIAVGEPGYSGYRGSVLIFSGADGTLVRRIVDPTGAANDFFGESLATIECLDGDGFRELVVGSTRKAGPGGSSAGHVLVLSPEDGVVRRDIVHADGGNDWMGWSVAVVSDVDGDGVDDIVAGARYADGPGGANAGKAVVFSGGTGAEIQELVAVGGQAEAQFGYAVASAGDLSGDGIPEILVGAPFEDGSIGLDEGRAMVFAREADCDGDGFAPFGGDCDDANVSLWALPGESLDLVFAADRRTMTWEAPTEPGGSAVVLSYDLLRAEAPSGFSAGVCVASGQSERSAEDAESPDAGGVFHYLARASNACGAGGLGGDSAGDERLGRICP